jgi:transposase InsO family protein
MKINHHPTLSPLNPFCKERNALPFQFIGIDFLTGLPCSQRFDSILVVVDHDSTKGLILIPYTKKETSLSTTKLLHRHVFQRFGLCAGIISNRGPQFASAVFKELCHLLDIKHSMSTAYHPQTDGQTEHANQEIEAMLRIFVTNNPEEWVLILPDIEFAYNNRIHTATKLFPFYALMGYNPTAVPHAYPRTNLPAA